jgi:predicted transposase/invertase (TIGR01784 family)
VVAEKSPVIKKAATRLMELSADEHARMLFESREKERRDNLARQRGAIKQAVTQNSLNIARNAIQMNMSTDDIIKLTGLTHAEIETLRNEL